MWWRDEQVYDLRTELSLQAHHAEDVTHHQSQEHAGLHQRLTGFVQETQQYRKMFEESRAANSATGPEIERLRQREAELLREVRQQNNARARFYALFFFSWIGTNPESRESRTSEDQKIIRNVGSEVMQLKSIRCTVESHQKS